MLFCVFLLLHTLDHQAHFMILLLSIVAFFGQADIACVWVKHMLACVIEPNPWFITRRIIFLLQPREETALV